MQCNLFLFGFFVTFTTAQPISLCSRVNCNRHLSCLNCEFPTCNLGEQLDINCTTLPECVNQDTIRVKALCNYCWQLDEQHYDCAPRTNCSTVSTKTVVTSCQVHPTVICKGNRTFSKKVKCRWTSGISWIKTLILSITLGGFGADRFYLGLWKSGIGKLFSFGGLGVWTVVDIILVATGYIRPADGSMYY